VWAAIALALVWTRLTASAIAATILVVACPSPRSRG
jgi:hypothetical protein